jgi:RNA polymerase sigma factor (TIGR02999 family)
MPLPQVRVTQLLSAVADEKKNAADDLLSLLYDELRALAHYMHQQQPAGNSLQPTALVHEAYVKLVRDRDSLPDERTHFFNIAALAMRQVLADHARRRRAAKRGGDWSRIDLGTIRSGSSVIDVDVMALDDALTKLAELDKRQARIVELRFLGGVTVAETARLLGVSSRTVELDWRMARAWLRRYLGDETSK